MPTKTKRKRRPRAREVEATMNRGLMAEFVIFLLFQGFDMFSNIWVLAESATVLKRIRKYEHLAANVSASNATVEGSYCVTDELQWSEDGLTKEIDHFEAVFTVYCVFIAMASCIFTLHLLAWLYTLQLSLRSREITPETRAALVNMKLAFLLAASLLQDIPLSTLTAELFTVQEGSAGLICRYCALSALCSDPKQFAKLSETASTPILLNVSAIGLTSLWKGISTFYRWSKIPNFSCFHIRACSSVFAGFLFVIVILTPAMAVLKYRYFALPGISPSLLSDAIDRVFFIGVISWTFCASVVCCCPLLHVIRMTS